MKPIITLKVEIEPGNTILKAFSEAIRIATELNVIVQFEFNGITCSSGPNDEAKKGERSYTVAVENNIDFAFSF